MAIHIPPHPFLGFSGLQLFPTQLKISALTCFVLFGLGEIVTGQMPKPILIKRDSHGETHIEEVKGEGQPVLTIERVRELEAIKAESQHH